MDIKDTTTSDAIANAFTIGGLFSFIMQFQAEITILVLLTGLTLNIIRIYDRFKHKKDASNRE